MSNGSTFLSGTCSECTAQVTKVASTADLELIRGHAIPNTTPDSAHEEKHSSPGGVGISSEIDPSESWTANDRIIYSWQNYAGRVSEKTVDRHLFAIRFFENALQGKSFGNLTVADVGRGRDTLKASLEARGPESRSKSTVAHIASHVSDFLVWLIKQEGFRRFPQDLPDYLKLPKAVYAKAKPQPARQYASLEEVAAMLQAMPKRSLMDRRARAIFAIAFLGSLRADTLISVRLCHVDLESKVIIQDADIVRAKNGKSLNINWFPGHLALVLKSRSGLVC